MLKSEWVQSLNFLKILFFSIPCICICVLVCEHERSTNREQKMALDALEMEPTGSHEPPAVGAENQTCPSQEQWALLAAKPSL